MDYYKFDTDPNRFWSIEPKPEDLFDRLGSSPIAADWRVPTATIVKHGKRPDLFRLAGSRVPVLSPRALDALRRCFDSDTEILSVDSIAGPLFAMNVLSIVDCLDCERSELVLTGMGSIHRIVRFVPKPDVAYPHCFRVAGFGSHLFCSGVVHEIIEAEKLSGACNAKAFSAP